MKLTPIACIVAGLGLALLALCGPAYRVGLLPLMNAFYVMLAGGAVALLALILAGIAIGLAQRHGAYLSLVSAAVALVVSLFVVGTVAQWLLRARSVPSIHDITTDLENPPTFEAVVPLRADAPNKLDRPAELVEEQRRGYPDLAPITLPIPQDQAFDRSLAVAQDLGWEIVTADKGSGRIEATDTTRWFGFKDDVVVRLTPWGAGTRIDVRSVSRVGRGDVGTNARRIERFLDELQES